MGSITDAAMLHHVCILLITLWLLNSFNCCHPIAYFLGLIYLYLIHEGYVLRLRKKLQFEEKRESNQRRVLSDSETVRWLNHAVEKIWPLCMEEIVSQKILLPIVPWFLQKYKPWTVKDIEVQHLYLGRSPPLITEMRVLPNSSGDDHLVLELGMNFRTADDMSAILGVKLRKRLGFGMWAKLHLLGMHVEGKVLVGVKFLRKWPFIGRLRVCFAGPPYFQMTVKPIFTHGLDVTELPGIAGWIDNLLAVVFEQTLVEPNMLVVDVEKFASPEQEPWFSVDAKDPIAFAIVEILEASEMKPSDLNGLADPYVKGRLGQYRFRTKTRKKTLAPKWQEEFKIPITSWDSENMLVMEVRDKDKIFDDTMGDCIVNISELRDGQRHDLWLPLQNIKMGRLHLAITVSEATAKDIETSCDPEAPDSESKRIAFVDASNKDSFSSRSSDAKSPKIADSFEPIDIEGKSETGIWIHHPGSELSQVWEPRKGRTRHRDFGDGVDIVASSKIPPSLENNQNDSSSSTDENPDSQIQDKGKSQNPVRKGFRKIGSVFQRSPRSKEKPEDSLGDIEPSPRDNVKSLNTKNVGVRLIIDDTVVSKTTTTTTENADKESHRGNVKGMAKSILKQGVKSARDLKHTLSRKASRKSKSPDAKDAGLDKDSCSNDEDDDDGCNLSSLDASAAKGGLIIASSDVSGRTSASEYNSNNSVTSLKDGDAVRKENIPIGNNSEDGDVRIPEEEGTHLSADNNNNNNSSGRAIGINQEPSTTVDAL